ncbi:MAG: hypothetical protein AB7P33_08775 [Dehalococcoidia bacterium]
MVVDLNDSDAVLRYTREHAAMGLEHVTQLVRGEYEAMMALIGDLTQDEADTRINDGEEYSVSMIIQHLNQSFARSEQRLRELSTGIQFVAPPGSGRGGGLPEVLDTDFNRVRQAFVDGEESVLKVLDAADPAAPLTLTAPHAQYGPYNWLEWAVYSHHVHTSDHTHQIAKIKAALRGS